MFKGSRFRQKLRECASILHRELKICVTRDVQVDKWIFVVGCYNSGTELLLNVLGAHPEISSLPVEGQFLSDDLLRDYALGIPRMWVLREDLFRLTEQDEGPDPVRLRYEWLMRLDRKKRMFVEKSPANAARTRWLQHHFENAHFIAVVRNGYAVAEGIRRKAEPHHRLQGWPIDLCARRGLRSNEILLEDAWDLRNIEWVTYEEFTEAPDEVFDRLSGFLDVHREGFRARGQWKIHEREEPIRNLNEASIKRLTTEERRGVSEVADSLLEHLRYANEQR